MWPLMKMLLARNQKWCNQLPSLVETGLKRDEVWMFHKECLISFISGRKIAIDASMSIYQFLIAVRSDGSQLTNEQGETTR